MGQALCIVALGLLDKQVNKQAWDFEKEGGFSERLYKVRQEVRGRAQGKGGATQQPAV